ncbi:hypothetical protein HDU83_001435 [Entophlyctis luteolus]|nr:hypothetical protein HDU83_001435 [Entophlyctis luteolus]
MSAAAALATLDDARAAAVRALACIGLHLSPSGSSAPSPAACGWWDQWDYDPDIVATAIVTRAVGATRSLLFVAIVAVLVACVLLPSLRPVRVVLTHARDTAPIGAWLRHSATANPRVEKTPLADLVRRACPRIARGVFTPTFWLPSGHLQTLWAAVLQKLPDLRADYDREVLDLPDGGIVAIDWAPRNHRDMPADSIPSAVANGYRIAAVNYRGCGGVEIRTPLLYAGSFTEDVRLMIKYIQSKNPRSPLVGVGYSLGANILLKYAGEEAENCPLIAAVSVANPFDFGVCSSMLHNSALGRIYSQALTSNLKQEFKKHKHVFEKDHKGDFQFEDEPVDASRAMKAKYLNDFDESVSRRMFGFRTVSEFYRLGGCAHNLPDIRIPSLILNDLDDPIALKSVIPYSDVLGNPYLILATTRVGGHIGWFEGTFFPKRWFPEPVMEFVKVMLDSYQSLPDQHKHEFNANQKMRRVSNHLVPVAHRVARKPVAEPSRIQESTPSSKTDDGQPPSSQPTVDASSAPGSQNTSPPTSLAPPRAQATVSTENSVPVVPKPAASPASSETSKQLQTPKPAFGVVLRFMRLFAASGTVDGKMVRRFLAVMGSLCAVVLANKRWKAKRIA